MSRGNILNSIAGIILGAAVIIQGHTISIVSDKVEVLEWKQERLDKDISSATIRLGATADSIANSSSTVK